jgi:hypothetical protein
MAVVKKVVKKTVMKKDDGGGKKKPIALAEVTVSAVRKKPMSTSTDSVSVGSGGKYKKYAVKDIKNMVKTNNMSSIDTSSYSNMGRSVYGKSPAMIDVNLKIAKNKK